MANPYDVAPPNVLQALMLGVQGYDRGKASADKATQDALYKQIGQQVQTGGLDNSALGQLFGLGPTAAPMLSAAAKLKEAQGANDTVYGTPIYGTTQDGKTGIGTFDKGGKFRLIDTGGFQPTPGGMKPVDLGGGYGVFNPRTGGMQGGPAYQPASGAPQTPGFIPKTGEVSKDYAPKFGPDGMSAAPIAGTPAAQKVREEQMTAVTRDEQTVDTGKLVKQYIGDARKLVKDAPWYNPAVGMGTGITEGVRGSNAANLLQATETIRSNIGFDRLQRMRDESPTGGALGAVAIQELQALQASLGSLANSQSPKQFMTNLDRVERLYDGVIRKAQAYPTAAKYGFAPAPKQAPAEASPASPQAQQFQRGQTATNPQTGERMVYDGRQWVPQ
jgi:hypothetical protein